jgi:hypothetical protein
MAAGKADASATILALLFIQSSPPDHTMVGMGAGVAALDFIAAL